MVVSVYPILSDRREGVDDVAILNHLNSVLRPRWNLNRLAGADENVFAGDMESGHTADDVAELFMIVRMGGNDRAAREGEVRDGHPAGGDVTTLDTWRQFLGGNRRPPVQCG